MPVPPAPQDRPTALEFPAGLEWLNVDRAPTLEELRGKIVALAFWSSAGGDARDQHAELATIAERFASELVVIGVHSPRFGCDKDVRHVRAAVLKHGIEHAVVHDASLAIAHAHGVVGTPAVVLVDAVGRALAPISGEGRGQELVRRIERLREEEGLDKAPIELPLRRESVLEPDRFLDHPSKLCVASESTLFVADTGHHRVLQLAYRPDGLRARVERIFGGGGSGFVDADGESAKLFAPHGLARQGRTLYVADTGNHAVRAIDLETGAVRTVAGTGARARSRPGWNRRPTETALRSPCALWVDRPRLYVAMAGSRELWTLEEERVLAPFAGNGRAAWVDGFAQQASFGRPSDLAGDGRRLFVADAEACAIRAVELVGRPAVHTLVGRGPTQWGDADGAGERVRLQHPLGIAFDGLLHVADTFNHKVKRLDPATREVRTLAGSGRRGHRDGSAPEAWFAEPEGVAVRGHLVFVADTGNHALRVIDVRALTVETVEIG